MGRHGLGRSGAALPRLLVWAVGIAVLAGAAWGVWEAVSGWNVTKTELKAYDEAAERTAATNDSLQSIIVERDSTIKIFDKAAAQRIAEEERRQRILEEQARVQAKASQEAGDVLDTHLAAVGDSIGLALHAQERALTNAERLTWQAEKLSLVMMVAEWRGRKDSIQGAYDQLWIANEAAQEALVKSDLRGDKWKDAARPTIAKVIKRTILPVVIAVGATVLVNQATSAASGG